MTAGTAAATLRHMTTLTGETVARAKMAAALRRVTVVPLADLCGPAEGMLELPVDVCWSLQDARFDLADRKQRITAYRYVFAAARRADHLIPYLSADLLKDVWAELRLVGRMRVAWETVNPELASAQTVRAA